MKFCLSNPLLISYHQLQNVVQRRTKGSEGDGAAHQPHLPLPSEQNSRAGTKNLLKHMFYLCENRGFSVNTEMVVWHVVFMVEIKLIFSFSYLIMCCTYPIKYKVSTTSNPPPCLHHMEQIKYEK